MVNRGSSAVSAPTTIRAFVEVRSHPAEVGLDQLTGEPEADLCHEVKAGYSYHCFHSPVQVHDLVDSRISLEKDGYCEAVDRLVAEFAKALPAASADWGALRVLRPVDPVTLELRRELRDRASGACRASRRCEQRASVSACRPSTRELTENATRHENEG